jgi:3-deoxy-D-manno-octulosonate 8-phosphate phosphatase (KDO 8-P phosphatase)
MSDFAQSLRDRLATVRALVLDVDGVLTDGSLVYGPEGEIQKTFHVRDGLGLRLLLRENIFVGIITAKRSPMLARRLSELGIVHVLEGREDKGNALLELATTFGIEVHEIAYVGDDVLDLPALRTAGVPITVADAHPFAREAAAWTTAACGGHGAVREVCDSILNARGRLHAACEELIRR